MVSLLAKISMVTGGQFGQVGIGGRCESSLFQLLLLLRLQILRQLQLQHVYTSMSAPDIYDAFAIAAGSKLSARLAC